MRIWNVRGPLGIVLTALAMLFCLRSAPAEADSGRDPSVLVGGSSMGQDLRDLVSFIHEETSLPAEQDPSEIPTWFELSRGFEQGHSQQAVGDSTAKKVLSDKSSVSLLPVSVGGSSGPR